MFAQAFDESVERHVGVDQIRRIETRQPLAMCGFQLFKTLGFECAVDQTRHCRIECFARAGIKAAGDAHGSGEHCRCGMLVIDKLLYEFVA